MTKNFELYEIHTVRKTGKIDEWRTQETIHDFDAPLPDYNLRDMVDSNPLTLGDAKEIVKYLLKYELQDYKLVKKRK